LIADLNHGFSRRILALKKDRGGVELGGSSKVKRKKEIGG
jgi:hypothetical protein